MHFLGNKEKKSGRKQERKMNRFPLLKISYLSFLNEPGANHFDWDNWPVKMWLVERLTILTFFASSNIPPASAQQSTTQIAYRAKLATTSYISKILI